MLAESHLIYLMSSALKDIQKHYSRTKPSFDKSSLAASITRGFTLCSACMTVLSAPTVYLPPIRKLQQCSVEEITRSLHYLQVIYSPELRGIRRVNRKQALQESESPSSASDVLDALRLDGFERSYAIRWLTALVSQAHHFLDSTNEGDSADMARLEGIIEQSAALLAVCAGTASAGTVSRVFRFHHGHPGFEVQLTDVTLENQDYSSVGAQTWGSAYLLAETLAENPDLFRLTEYANGLRALELGAGTGLVSITLGKILQARPSGSYAVVATDFHSSVLTNLRQNIQTNFATPISPDFAISTHTLNWSQFGGGGVITAPLDEPFDLILGADVIYEAEHAMWIKGCVERLLRKSIRLKQKDDPSRPPAQFHLVIPLRPTHILECTAVEEVFPFAETLQSDLPQAVSGILAITSKDVIVCEAYDDVRPRTGGIYEVEYGHYIIEWFV